MAPSASGSVAGFLRHGRLAHAPGDVQRLADDPPQQGQVERA